MEGGVYGLTGVYFPIQHTFLSEDVEKIQEVALTED